MEHVSQQKSVRPLVRRMHDDRDDYMTYVVLYTAFQSRANP